MAKANLTLPLFPDQTAEFCKSDPAEYSLGIKLGRRTIDIRGERFGRLVVTAIVGYTSSRSAIWECICDCGRKNSVRGQALKQGMTQSCGCLNDQVRRERHLTDEEIALRKRDSWQSWYSRNRQQQIEKAVIWSQQNRERWNANRRKRLAERMSDPAFRLAKNLRSRLRLVLKGKVKTGSAIADLGCTTNELTLYLEQKFYNRADGTAMTWENYGRTGWQVDHIIPLATLREGKTVQELCHYSNLQPLWFEDNLAKRNAEILNNK